MVRKREKRDRESCSTEAKAKRIRRRTCTERGEKGMREAGVEAGIKEAREGDVSV